MANVVLRTDALGKQYRLGMVGRTSFAEDAQQLLKRMAGRDENFRAEANAFWALWDVSLKLHEGEVLGLIGKNGAGKSTFLKLLAQITAPTTGRIRAKGRVAGLLEVGTGMHPELSGRENIFLNGAILGLTRAEIAQRFDDIVDFSGCSQHIDTPVKRYSSGMKVRLGFAVAAFLEPDILAIDEVLAVGDAAFQQKAIARLQEVCTRSGRSAIFVSHNMASVRSVCSRVVCLEQGIVRFDGSAEQGIAAYLGFDAEQLQQERIWDERNAPQTENVRVERISLAAVNKSPADVISIDEPMEFAMQATVHSEAIQLDCTLQIYSDSGLFLASTSSLYFEAAQKEKRAGKLTFCCKIPANYFNEGIYRFSVLLIEDGRSTHLKLEHVLRLCLAPPVRNAALWMGKPGGQLLPGWPWSRHFDH